METNNKLREALDDIIDKIDTWRSEGSMEHWQYSQLFDIADAALAEPVKNCEVGAPAEQTARFAEFCKSHIHSDLPKCAGCPLEDIPDGTGCAQVWAQMPYEEGVPNAE